MKIQKSDGLELTRWVRELVALRGPGLGSQNPQANSLLPRPPGPGDPIPHSELHGTPQVACTHINKTNLFLKTKGKFLSRKEKKRIYNEEKKDLGSKVERKLTIIWSLKTLLK